MKKLFQSLAMIIFIATLMSSNSYSQIAGKPPEENTPQQPLDTFVDSGLFLGGGISFGLFFPSDVNQEMKNILNYNNITITDGFSEMYMYYLFRLHLGYRFSENSEIISTIEYCWAPKYFIVMGGSDQYFHFDRVAFSLMYNHSIISKEKYNFFLGAGLTYDMLEFENFKSEQFPGFRINTGVKLKKTSLNPRLIVSFDFVSGDAKDGFDELSLNYTGINFGMMFDINLY